MEDPGRQAAETGQADAWSREALAFTFEDELGDGESLSASSGVTYDNHFFSMTPIFNYFEYRDFPLFEESITSRPAGEKLPPAGRIPLIGFT